MDFHSLSRKELQALCKNNKIPANMTNVAMADALKALQHVEGLEEFLNPSDSDLSKPAEETLIGSPDIPRTACRTSTRRKPIQEEPKSTQPLTRTRRGTRGRTAEDIDQENKDVNVPTTPAVASGRRRAPAASARRNIETQMREDEEDRKNEAKGRSAVPSSRGQPPVASARRKLETQKEENSVQGVYSTRRSVRLLENKMAKLCMMKNGSAEPVNIDRDLFEEMANSSERSEVSVEVEKNIHGTNTQTISEVGSDKTDDLEVSSDPKAFGSLEIERELKVGVKDKDKSDDVYELNVFKSEAVGDEAHDEGSDESDVISSEKFEKSIDVDDETVEKGPADVSVTVQEDSLAIKASTDVFAEVKDHVVASQSLLPEYGSIDCDSVEESLEPNLQSSSSHAQDENPQDKCQKNLASKDSHINVVVDDDLGSHDSESEDSESEYTTEGESDEDNASDANSSDCEENISDDDAEIEEKDPEAPVLPEYQMVGDTTIDNDSGSESFIAEHSAIESVDFAEKESPSDDDYVMDDGIPKFKKNMSPGLVISDSEVTLSTVATNSLSGDPMAKVQESSKSESLVDGCVMPELECPPSLDKTPISDSKVICEIPSQPFAADQISGQFPRPTQLTEKKSSAIKQSIEKITDVSDDDDEDLDNGNGKLELEKDKTKQDENTVDGDSILEIYTGMSSVDGDGMLPAMFAEMSLRQLKKKVKECQITQNRKKNNDKSAPNEQVGKKRVALKPLRENSMEENEIPLC